jgi:prevent-host-death family protein
MSKGDKGMRTLSADAKEIKVHELIEAARTEPVTVLENGVPAVVVLSPSEFDRLDEQDRIRREAKARLRQTIAAIQKDAAERGLTDSELERLLADES